MQIARRCLLVLVLSSCASDRRPVVAASSLAADPMLDLVEIPTGACPGYAFDFALSERGLRGLLADDIRIQRDHAAALAHCQTRAEIAEARAESAVAAAKAADWWQRYGPIVAVGLGVVGAGFGVAAGVGLGRALHVRDVRGYQPTCGRDKRDPRLPGCPRQFW